MGCVAAQGRAQPSAESRCEVLIRQRQEPHNPPAKCKDPAAVRNDTELDFHDKFMLGKKLGRGAFGQVRIATERPGQQLSVREQDSRAKQDVAVKIINLRDKDKPAEVSNKLQMSATKEANIWKTVGCHPHCVGLRDLFLGNTFCYMVMEKCNMGLYQALESVPDLTERALGNFFAQMLLGISHCHSVNVVHRDIKPDNFLVGGEGEQVVKLCDFGLSALIPRTGMMTGSFGTPPFMCPEMVRGECYDEKADVWSFAVIVYTLLFGSLPYMPKEENLPKEASSRAMKKAIRVGAHPSFEPVATGRREDASKGSSARSEAAMELVMTLLDRDQKTRPSAEEALRMPWMAASLLGYYPPHPDLPPNPSMLTAIPERSIWKETSLRPMLHAAKKIGVFEMRDPSIITADDVQLNLLQTPRHSTPPSKAKDVAKKVHWEDLSNRSTTCVGSDGHSSDWEHPGSDWSTGNCVGHRSSLHSDTGRAY